MKQHLMVIAVLFLVACGTNTPPKPPAPPGPPTTGVRPAAVQGPSGLLLDWTARKTRKPDTFAQLAWKPDGTQIVGGSHNSGSFLWDVRSNQMIRYSSDSFYHPYRHPFCANNVVSKWSPDGKYLVCRRITQSNVTGVWDYQLMDSNFNFTRMDLAVGTIHTGGNTDLETTDWSPDSTRLLVAGYGMEGQPSGLKIFSVPSGALLQTLDTEVPIQAKWSPDGTKVAALYKIYIEGDSPQMGTTLKVFDVQNNSLLFEVKNQMVWSFAWSPDSSQVAVTHGSYSSFVQFLNSTSGEFIKASMLRSLLPSNYEIAWHPSENLLAFPTANGHVDVYNTSTWEMEQTLGEPGMNTSWNINQQAQLAWSADGSKLVHSTPEGNVHVSDFLTGETLQDLPTVVDGHDRTNTYQVAVHPSGKYLASTSRDGRVFIYDTVTSLPAHKLPRQSGAVYSAAWNPAGDVLASAGEGGTIDLWNTSDLTTAPTLKNTLYGHTYTVRSLAWHPQGTQLVSGGWDSSVRLWDVTTGTEIRKFEGHQDYVNAVLFNPAGTLLATASSDKTVKIWNPSTGEVLQTLTFPDAVFALAWSHDGQMLATGEGSVGRTVKVWNTTTWQLGHTLQSSLGAIRSLAWNKDNRTLFEIGNDTTIRAWDVPSGYLLFDWWYGEDYPIFSLALSPDDKRLYVGGTYGYVDAWSLQFEQVPTQFHRFVRDEQPQQVNP